MLVPFQTVSETPLVDFHIVNRQVRINESIADQTHTKYKLLLGHGPSYIVIILPLTEKVLETSGKLFVEQR